MDQNEPPGLCTHAPPRAAGRQAYSWTGGRALRFICGFWRRACWAWSWGWLLGPRAEPLAIPSQLVLRLLGALAAPLVLMAVVQALMQAQIPRGQRAQAAQPAAAQHAGGDLHRPGRRQHRAARASGRSCDRPRGSRGSAGHDKADPLAQFLDNVPRSLLGPFTDDGKVTSVILIALAFGIALRRLPAGNASDTVADLVDVGFDVCSRCCTGSSR